MWIFGAQMQIQIQKMALNYTFCLQKYSTCNVVHISHFILVSFKFEHWHDSVKWSHMEINWACGKGIPLGPAGVHYTEFMHYFTRQNAFAGLANLATQFHLSFLAFWMIFSNIATDGHFSCSAVFFKALPISPETMQESETGMMDR